MIIEAKKWKQEEQEQKREMLDMFKSGETNCKHKRQFQPTEVVQVTCVTCG